MKRSLNMRRGKERGWRKIKVARNFRSFTMIEIRDAIMRGKTIWELDTDNYGEDDFLIGDIYEEVLGDVLDYHELDELPKGWSLERVDWTEALLEEIKIRTSSKRSLNMRRKEFGKVSGKIDMSKHIWEGWTVGDFINELEPVFNQIMSGRSWQKPFGTKEEVKEWAMSNQPYYKKNIPEVVNYFWDKVQSKDIYAKEGTRRKLRKSSDRYEQGRLDNLYREASKRSKFMMKQSRVAFKFLEYVKEEKYNEFILDEKKIGGDVYSADIYIYGDLNFDINIYLDTRQVVENTLNSAPKMQEILSKWLDDTGSAGWSKDIKEFCEEKGYEFISSDNTYNYIDSFMGNSDMEIYIIVDDKGDTYSIISYHLGGDIRGNYTDCIVYEGNYYEEVSFYLEYGDSEIKEEYAYRLGYEGDYESLDHDIKSYLSVTRDGGLDGVYNKEGEEGVKRLVIEITGGNNARIIELATLLEGTDVYGNALVSQEVEDIVASMIGL